ncbi:hypothetical protein LUZ63_014911 [Rhynchospora breviuscula]|uniref:Protein NO VEIN C-terminal domain-containing protein n=1 Tax=Rhynchospora breviuscula TaxID=2022672 RepID=A0A9Q0CBC6_9POAL|nr:hypothetical protein LUZ63_014911 [Rhynchospora breviuscula]
MQNPSDRHHRRRRSGRGNRGPRPPWPGNASSSSHPNLHQPSNPQILQRPMYASSAIPLDRVEAAVVRAHAEIVAAGESVTSWKVSQATALSLQAGSWGALGYSFNDVPTLRNIQAVERKVNAFIHCFVSVRRMTSLYDLKNELCKNEGVETFEELGLGNLLRHPLILQYFSIPPDTTEICQITTDNLLSSLSTFIYKYKSKEIPVEEFLDSLLKKYPVARKEYLGVRITSFGLYIGFLKGIRRNESAMLRSFKETEIKRHELESSSNVITQPESNFSQTDDFGDSLHHLFSLDGQSTLSARNKSHTSSSSFCHLKSFGLKIEIHGESDFKVLELDKAKAINLIVEKYTLQKFVAAWKKICLSHSTKEVLKMMSACREGKKRKKKSPLLYNTSFPGVMLFNIAVKAIRAGLLDYVLEHTDSETARWSDHGFVEGELYDEVTLKFIEKWREPCKKHRVYEVIALMLHVHGGQTKAVQKVFLSSIGAVLLNLALEVIKSSPDNNIKSECTSFEERTPEPVAPKNETDSQVTPTEEKNNRTETEQELTLDVNTEGILKNITSYFEIDHPYDSKKHMPIIKKLVLNGCEMWLKREYSVTDFSNLGFGNFYDFLDKHISSLPMELHHFLAGDISCNSLEVSLNQNQLHLMLDQARHNLGGKANLDKNQVYQILRNQFPSISLTVSENRSAFDASVSPCSVYFSSTLITLQGNSRLLDEEVERSSSMCELSISSVGPVSAKDARECLVKAPFLADLQLWSHWDSVFAPSLGPLIEWLLHEGYIEGLSCIVTRAGCIIRVNDRASFDDLFEAFLHGSPAKVALLFISLFVIHGGSYNFPLSLFKWNLQRAVDLKIKNTTSLDCREPFADVSNFILDCLDHLPLEFRSFAAQVLISILCTFTKDACQIILRQCKGAHKRVILHEIGLSLGIVEWINDYKEFNVGPIVDLDADLKCAVSEFSEPKSVSRSTVEILGGTGTTDSEFVDMIGAAKEMSGKFDEKICSDITNEQIRQGNDLIEAIRREEFGLDPGISFAESVLLKKQHARLGRALQCLSNELYSQDSHFLLELVQNADDNVYSAEVEPTLVFILHSNGIVVLNNERGFSDKNIRALCDVGSSTKKGLSSGYIGKKGIGFKSVFRVTDAPEIHSNGFHIKFDISEGEIGFILPTRVPPCDIKYINEKLLHSENQAVGEAWGTCIILPFKPKHRSDLGRTSLLSMFSELHPSLLLFLKNLRCIRFKNNLDGTIITMRKLAGVDGMVIISHGTEEMNWLVVSRELNASELRPEVKTTRISLAFRLDKTGNGEYEPHLDQQPTFAYLPLRKYGMRFILQADFSLPSSREEVDHDSAWNQWLLSKVPDLFVTALKSFCKLSFYKDKPARAISAFMAFVPLVGEVHGFFTSLPHMILSRLRVSDCLLLEGSVHEWIQPCRALRGWDNNARSFISDGLLRKHVGLSYLNRDIVLSAFLAKELAVQEYNPNLLVQILESVCGESDNIDVLSVEWLSLWLNSFYMTLATQSNENELDLLSRLRKVPFIPLSDSMYVSMTDGPVWFPCNLSALQLGDLSVIKQFQYLYSNLRTVSPAIFSYCSDEYSGAKRRVENIIAILQKLGVKQLSAHDVIKNHILEYNFGEGATETKKELFVEFVSFVFEHFQTHCSDCCIEKADIIEKLRKEPIILTTGGFKSPVAESIHFSKEFGNCISVDSLICGTGITWHEVDNTYLKHTKYAVAKWREFLKDLGVSDFVQLIEVQKQVTDGDVPVRDWLSPEMDALLSEISQTGNLEKSKYLLQVVDELWDDCFSQKMDEEIRPMFFLSTFAKRLCDFKWVASSWDDELHFPTELFYKHKPVFSVLGANAPYAIPKISSKALLKHLGFKVKVQFDDILSAIKSWTNSTSHKASISQMFKLYSLAWDETTSSREKLSNFKSSLCIFLPSVRPPDQTKVVPGVFLSPAEAYWDDPAGCLDLIREMNHKGFSTSTVSSVYPDLYDFFVTACGVLELPSPNKYFEILLQVARVKSPKEAAHVVLRVLLRWADDLSSGKMKSEQLMELINNLVKEESTVLPTIQDRWVSLHPNFGLVCWTDRKELIEEFTDAHNVYFVHFGELTDAESEALSGKLASILQEIGVTSLEEVLSRKAIFYDVVDSSEKACMVNWVLPYAQQYIYSKHPSDYLQLQQVGNEKLSQLNVVAVQKLFYKNTLKENTISGASRLECTCLLEGSTLYVTTDADTHSIILELSRLFFLGASNLELANFLHALILMSEVGSTKQQLELYIKHNQQLLDVAAGEKTWTLKSFTESTEEDTPIPVQIHKPVQQRSSKTIKRENKSSMSPPPSSEVASCSSQMSADDCPKMAKISVPKDIFEGEIQTMELKDIPVSSQKDKLSLENQDELKSYHTGRRGEHVAYKYFTEIFGTACVKWVNEESESGLPYDITVERKDGDTEFIEVKATQSDTKDWFIISPAEWNFAGEKGDLFSIAWVFLSDLRKPKVLVLKNPLKLCKKQVLKLVLSL